MGAKAAVQREPQSAARALLHLGERGLGLFKLVGHILAVAEKSHADFSEGETPCCALQQARSQPVFKQADLFADIGLGHAQLFGRCGKIARLDHTDVLFDAFPATQTQGSPRSHVLCYGARTAIASRSPV